MSGGDLVGLIASGAVCLLVLIIGILLLHGKCSFLIAGFNVMTKREKERFDEKALSRFVGWVMIAIFLCSALLLVGGVLNRIWLVGGGVACILALCFGAAVYANTGNRFRK